jgi:hypothetical protein
VAEIAFVAAIHEFGSNLFWLHSYILQMCVYNFVLYWRASSRNLLLSIMLAAGLVVLVSTS